MKKMLLIFILLLFSTVLAQNIDLREYDEFEIPTGTHLQVISLQEFSSAICEEGDNVYFQTTSDIYLYDKKVIPIGTKLIGYIDKKYEPIIGTHAAMSVFINKMYFPDGTLVPVKAAIYSSNNNLLGGGLTEPAEYIKMPHYQRWTMFRAMGTLRYVPGATRKMGEHITVSSGADLIVVLLAPIYLSHIPIN